MIKFCIKCKKAKSTVKFSKNSKRRDNLQVWCKSCWRAYHAERAGKVLFDQLSAEEELIIGHTKLARSIAISIFKTATNDLRLDEVESVAFTGLVDAAKKWFGYCTRTGKEPDPDYFKFYAQTRIRGAIYDDFRATDWASRTERTRSRMLRDAGQDTGASVSAMADATGLDEKKVRSTMQAMTRKPVSLEAGEYDNHKTDEDVETSVFTKGIITAMATVYESLSLDKQAIVALKYYIRLSMAEISIETGFSVAKVSQLHRDAVTSMHKAMLEIALEEQ